MRKASRTAKLKEGGALKTEELITNEKVAREGILVPKMGRYKKRKNGRSVRDGLEEQRRGEINSGKGGKPGSFRPHFERSSHQEFWGRKNRHGIVETIIQEKAQSVRGEGGASIHQSNIVQSPLRWGRGLQGGGPASLVGRKRRRGRKVAHTLKISKGQIPLEKMLKGEKVKFRRGPAEEFS